jgi:hypothetical protein
VTVTALDVEYPTDGTTMVGRLAIPEGQDLIPRC